MMDKISESLGTLTPVSSVTESKKDTLPEVIEEKTKDIAKRVIDNLSNDYESVRENLHKLIEESMAIIPEVFHVVKESQSARMYESASGFIKMVSELNKDLIGVTLDLEKRKSGGSGIKNDQSEVQ